MNAVNLLPAGTGRRRAGGGGKRPVAVLAAAAVLVAGGYRVHTERQEAAALGDQVAAAQGDKAALEARLQAMLAVDQRASAQLARRGLVVQLTGSRINWERLVRDTVTVAPRGVWLTQVTGTSPVAGQAAAPAPPGQPATAPVPQGLHVEGYAFGQPQVARFLARLDAVPGLGEPRLTSSERMRRGGRTVVQFIVDVPVDRRAQDRPTLTVEASAPAGAPVAPGAGGFVP